MCQSRNPTPVHAIQLPGSPEDLAIGHGIAYVTLGSSGLAIVDCRQDPWWVIGTLDTPGSAGAIALSGSYLYIADYLGRCPGRRCIHPLVPPDRRERPVRVHLRPHSLRSLPVRGGPRHPRDRHQCAHGPARLSAHSHVNNTSYPRIEVRGPIAYSCASGGVEVLDVSDPEHLSILGFISGYYSIGVDPDGELVYSIGADPGDAGLYIFWGQCAPTTAVEDRDGVALRGAAGTELQIAPNPSVPGRSTRIRLEMSGTGVATDALQASPSRSLEVSIYDATGRRVRRLPEAALRPGPLDVTWDGFDAKGHQVAPGVYLVRAAAAGATRTARVVITK